MFNVLVNVEIKAVTGKLEHVLIVQMQILLVINVMSV